MSRRPAAARTNIEMPVVFIARANFTRSGTLLLVAQASGLLFPASRRKPFATTIIFPTTANPHAASPREIWRDAKFNRRDACSTQKHPGGCCVRPVQRIGNKPSPERNLFKRPSSPRPSPPGEGELSAGFLKIRATEFAGQSSAEPEICERCSFSPGEKVRLRAVVKPFSFHAGCCCVRQCSEPEPSTRSTA